MQQFSHYGHQPGPTIAAGYVIYVIHVDYPDGTHDHYVGSTKIEEFPRRMRAHAGGYGTKTTCGMYGKRPTMWLVRTWDRPDRSWEKTLHRQNDHATWCSLCSPTLTADMRAVPAPFRLDGADPPRVASLSIGIDRPRLQK